MPPSARDELEALLSRAQARRRIRLSWLVVLVIVAAVLAVYFALQ